MKGLIKVDELFVDLNKELLSLEKGQPIENNLDKVLWDISKSIIKKHKILNSVIYHSYNTANVGMVLKRDYNVELDECDLLIFEKLVDLYIANNRELLLN